MRTYKLQKNDGTGRRHSEVREKRVEWNIPAIIFCILLAVAIWLYVVSFMPPLEGELPIETKPPHEDVTPSDPAEASRGMVTGEDIV